MSSQRRKSFTDSSAHQRETWTPYKGRLLPEAFEVQSPDLLTSLVVFSTSSKDAEISHGVSGTKVQIQH
jgi:hypothetical protein